MLPHVEPKQASVARVSSPAQRSALHSAAARLGEEFSRDVRHRDHRTLPRVYSPVMSMPTSASCNCWTDVQSSAVEIYCADCGCLVERGVRVIPCDTPECCCLDLPVADPMETTAARLRVAFNARDMDAFRGLFSEDAIWGDDPEHPSYCHSRSDIISNYKRLLGEGVKATMVNATTGPLGGACVLDVQWPDRETWRPQRQNIYQAYLVRDGKITAIHGYDDEAAALDAISN